MKNEKLEKPRLIFFRWLHSDCPNYVNLHLHDHVICLSNFFDVIEINNNCDYAEVCDVYQPSLALFESGVYSNEHKIINTSVNPEIPRIGLCNADANCVTRSVFLSDMERWKIDTFFTISMTMSDYTQSISERLFIWPNFINENYYKDYNITKSIPVLFTGSQDAHYPWRRDVFRLVSEKYPTLKCPHFGWFGKTKTSNMYFGERYARLINASFFVPACGTIAKELVRKHFEVPGCNTCLITEKTASVESAGFIDMYNCVFADKHDILDKLEYLFENQEKLNDITKNGFRLVHAKHTAKHRDQIYQWFILNKSIKSNQKIIQINPFEPLQIIESTSKINSFPVKCNGLDKSMVDAGDELLVRNHVMKAEGFYMSALEYGHFMAEAALKIGICSLLRGDIVSAKKWVTEPIKRNIFVHSKVTPDPIEWSYFIIILLCEGNIKEALKQSNAFSFVSQRHINYTRTVTSLINKNLMNKSELININIEISKPENRYSIHQIPWSNFNEWVNHMRNVFKIYHQERILKILSDDNLRYYIDSNLTRRVGLSDTKLTDYLFDNKHIRKMLGNPDYQIVKPASEKTKKSNILEKLIKYIRK